MNALFYKRSGNRACHAVDLDQYSCTVWRPGLFRIRPKGLPLFPFAVWWIFHQLRVFRNRGYAIVLIYDRDRVIHRSVITPGYFRFPFMGDRDLQVGDTWTDPEYRGKGLASVGLNNAVAAMGDRECWYLTAEDNLPSIRVAENTGFHLAGAGVRTSRFGVRLLGSYLLQKTESLIHEQC